jgi:hypothetical protein
MARIKIKSAKNRTSTRTPLVRFQGVRVGQKCLRDNKIAPRRRALRSPTQVPPPRTYERSSSNRTGLAALAVENHSRGEPSLIF